MTNFESVEHKTQMFQQMPKVGEFGYFWNDEDGEMEFGNLVLIDEFYHTRNNKYKNCSLDIPAHIKQYTEQ